MKNKQNTKATVTNKNLSIDYSDWKKNITSKRYCYYDFDRSMVENIAKKNDDELTDRDFRVLVQSLFPQYLLCSGLFDSVVLFDVIDGVRIDPSKYCYRNIYSYLNNDNEVKVNRLINEIEELFKLNNIACSDDWTKSFKKSKESA